MAEDIKTKPVVVLVKGKKSSTLAEKEAALKAVKK